MTLEDMIDHITAYDGLEEIEKMLSGLYGKDASSDAEKESPIGKMERIFEVKC